MPTKRPVFKVADAPSKRIVFQHVHGPLTGLYAIMGLTDQFGLKPGQALPTEAEGFEAQGRVVEFAGLVKVTNRYALYREPLEFGGKKSRGFDARQQ